MAVSRSDTVLLAILGENLTRARIDANLTQADLADESGLSKRTVERIEAGESSQTVNIFRILKVLHLEEKLFSIFPGTGPRPMDLLNLGGHARQRVAKSTRKRRTSAAWVWGDDAKS